MQPGASEEGRVENAVVALAGAITFLHLLNVFFDELARVLRRIYKVLRIFRNL